MRTLIAVLLLASSTAAGFLPLIQDRPKRDNPHDPRLRSLAPPAVVFPTYTPVPTPLPGCSVGPDTANFATFEAGAESWVSETYTGYTILSVAAGPPSCFGTQSLAGSATLTHAAATLHMAFKKDLTALPQNWTSRALTVRFNFPSTHAASTANIYVKVGVSYTARAGVPLAGPVGGGWVSLTLDMGNLAPAEAADVKEVGVDVFSGPTDPDGAVTYRIDAFNLLGGPTPTITPTFSASPTIAFGTPTVSPTASPTASPTPGCGGADSGTAFATFESTADSFTDETCCSYLPLGPALSASTFCKGGQSLCGSATVTHAGLAKQAAFKRNFTPAQNWSGRVLTAWAYASPGFSLSSIQIYIKSNGFVYSNGPISNAPAGGGWVMARFDLSGPPTFIVGATNTAQVEEVGLQIYSNASDPDGSLSFCIDEFISQ